ncbi:MULTISPECIES: Gfo/Idh/MocA family oxidoreductase [unclassified Nostoc]|uniref:Gfo/Idh/MocA family protein n=1 Tax=unclassified Nostoc TaxID=2593658 RepID=UPI002AD2404F|nr:Gfo/Idh/MocA family oxidoreductase [Nostoc sp. DedQUE03]MDZ7972223.1 Gfo/Idh/MocA family oxidoreductase [Nostoc sp. DedQUE03]MDZ8044571.1 Gfo/Idh/MocA family oxidoreductase [Nostoc sp. DedQUE02]
MAELFKGNFSRRQILASAGLGAVSAAAIGSMGEEVAAQQPTGQTTPRGGELPPQIEFAPISEKTEVDTGGPPTALPPERRLGFAIVGLGRLSLEEIMPAFAECKLAKPTALVSGDAAKANQVAQQYGIKPQNVYNYQNYDNLRNNSDVDVIYIVLPNSMHREYTVRGAKAGKHILCEKPMATTVEDAQQMIDACKQANRKLMIAYRCQYEPHHRAMIQMIRSKELGTIKVIQADNGQNQGGDLNQWRLKRALAGGGSLPDVGIYCLNATRYLTGEEPIAINAQIFSTPGDPRFKEVEESVTFQLRFPSGVLGICSTSYGFHEGRRFRVFGSDAWGQLDPAFSYSGLRMMVSRKSPTNSMAENISEVRIGEKNQFALEIDHMADCVIQNKQPHTPGEEGLQDQKLMALIYEAAQTGKTITLPRVSGLDTTRGPAPRMLK